MDATAEAVSVVFSATHDAAIMVPSAVNIYVE